MKPLREEFCITCAGNGYIIRDKPVLGWVENKNASGGRNFINRKKRKEIFIDDIYPDAKTTNARVKPIDSGYWEKSIDVSIEDSLEKIIQKLKPFS